MTGVSSMRIARALVPLAFAARLLGAQATPVSDSVPALDSLRMLHMVAVLAADSMEGRKAGTRGGERARNVLLGEFARIGLQPLARGYAAPFNARSVFAEANPFSTPCQPPASQGRRPTCQPSKPFYPTVRGVNLLGVVRGTVHPDRYIVVSAHYDHLVAQVGGAPGVARSEWRTIARVRSGQLLRWPSIAARDGDVYVVANVPLTSSSTGNFENGAVFFRGDERALLPPRDSQVMLLPKVIVDPLGRVHLFWAEGAVKGFDARAWGALPCRVMHAVRTADGGWTVPEVVLAAEHISWPREGLSSVFDDTGNPVLALSALLAAGTLPQIVTAKWDGATWQARTTSLTGSSPALARVTKSSIVLAAAAPMARGGAGVAFRVSDDDGRTWKELGSTIETSGNSVRPLLQMVGPDLLLVSQQTDTRVDMAAARIMLAWSHDDGNSWQLGASPRTSPNILSIHVVAARCGPAFLLLGGLEADGNGGARPTDAMFEVSRTRVHPHRLPRGLAVTVDGGLAENGDMIFMVRTGIDSLTRTPVLEILRRPSC